MYDENERKRQKDDYEFFKSRGICTRCRKEYAEIGKTMCSACLEYKIRIDKKRLEENPKAVNRRSEVYKESYQKLKEAGICTVCRKHKVYAPKSTTRCYECYLRQRRQQKKYDANVAKHWKEADLCIRCGSERVDGRVVCAECLEKMRKTVANARTYIDKKKHIWKKTNKLSFCGSK